MEISLHDNWVYALCVDHESQMIVLHTVYPHSEPYEFTDVIFADVLVHHFETQCMTTDPRYPSNVLFDIEEEEAGTTLGRYWDFISSNQNYGWPASGWNGRGDLAGILTSQGHRCFHIHGTVGLDGFVFAMTMILRPRTSKWTAQSEQVVPPNR